MEEIHVGSKIQIYGEKSKMSSHNQKYYFEEGEVIKKAKTKNSYLILFEDGIKKWFSEEFLYTTPYKFTKVIDDKNDIKLSLDLYENKMGDHHIIITAWLNEEEVMYRRWDDEKGKECSSSEWKAFYKDIKEGIYDKINKFDKNELTKYGLTKY